MAMIECAECQKDVPEEAAVCPSCGVTAPGQKKKGKSRKLLVVGIAVSVLVVAGLWLLQSTFSSEPLAKIPVAVELRPAVRGVGRVLLITNTADRPLDVVVSLSRPSTDETSDFDLSLDPGRAASIGQVDGWELRQGDDIRVRHADYKPWHGTVSSRY